VHEFKPCEEGVSCIHEHVLFQIAVWSVTIDMFPYHPHLCRMQSCTL